MTTQPPAPALAPIAPTPAVIVPAVAAPAAAVQPTQALKWAPMSSVAPRKRLVMSLMGHQKTGKTHFSLEHTPRPVFYANIDLGTEGVTSKIDVADVQEVVVRYEKGKKQEEYKRLWSEVEDLYNEALAHNSGTLVIDSESQRWELQMLAEFGRTEQIMPRDRGNLNSDKRAFINACLASDMNIIFCSRVREVWLNNAPTGSYERRGYNGLDYDCQVVSWGQKRHNPALLDAAGNVVGGTEFGIQVMDSRLNPSMEGKTYWGPMCRFDLIMELSWQR